MTHDLLQQLSTAVLVVDEDLSVQVANASACELLGIGTKRINAMAFASLFQQHDFNLERLAHFTLQRHSECQQYKVPIVTLDGRHTMVVLHAKPLADAQILIELRQLDDELKQEQASIRQHQFLAAKNLIRGLAHEIKNPLGGIRGAAQLIELSAQEAEMQECATLIMNQSDRLSALVDRLLGPQTRLHKRWCNLHQVLEDVVKVCQFDELAPVRIIKDYDPSIPDIFIDDDQMQQVFLNVLRNAQQALMVNTMHQDGAITIRTRIKHQYRLGDKTFKNAVCIQICDNGAGIAEDVKDTLFFPMVSTKDDGSGLGLAIAQTLVEQHQGIIECESWTGYTEFTIILPLTQT